MPDLDEGHREHNHQVVDSIQKDVEKYGYAVGLIGGTNYLPPFGYSIGFHKTFQHPEIIIIGLNLEFIKTMIDSAFHLIESGEKLQTQVSYADFLLNYDVQFIEVHPNHYPDYLGYMMNYYNYTIDFPVLQMVWPDKEHNWPWEENCTFNYKELQPLLDRNLHFKFREEENLAVFTTSQVLEGKPILYVYHDEDGTWQFHSELAPKEKDAKVVALKTLVNLDPTLNEIYYLDYGEMASRIVLGADWTTESYDNLDEEDNS